MQPRAVRKAHAEKITAEYKEMKQVILICSLALVDREKGVNDVTRELLDEYAEVLDEKSDEELQEAIDNARDRILTLTTHRRLSSLTAAALAVYRWGMDDI